MIPSKRPLSLKPLPTTSQPKALLAAKKAALTKPVIAKLPTAKLPGVKPPTPEKKPRERREWGGFAKWQKITLAVVIFLVGGGGLYAAVRYFSRAHTVAEVKDLQFKVQDPSLPEEDRAAMQKQLGADLRSLPRDKQRELRMGGGGFFGGRGEDRMKQVLAMKGDDLNKALDDDIAAILKRDKERGDQNGGPGGGPGGPGGPGGNGSGAGGPGGGGDGQGQGTGRRGGASDPNQPNARRDRMLSSVPAPARAQRQVNRELRATYNGMLQSRAQSQGITLPSTGGGRGRG